MRVSVAITTAAEARFLTNTATAPKPNANEVCERIEAYANNGKSSVVYPALLPSETVSVLEANGFIVKVGNVGTVIEW